MPTMATAQHTREYLSTNPPLGLHLPVGPLDPAPHTNSLPFQPKISPVTTSLRTTEDRLERLSSDLAGTSDRIRAYLARSFYHQLHRIDAAHAQIDSIMPAKGAQADGRVGYQKDPELSSKLQTVSIGAEAIVAKQANGNPKVKIHREVCVQVDDLPYGSSLTKEEATNTDSNTFSGRIIRPSKTTARDQSRSKARESRAKTLAFIESSDAEDSARPKGRHRSRRDAQRPENSRFAFSSSSHDFNGSSSHHRRPKSTSPPATRHRVQKTVQDSTLKHEYRQRAKSNERWKTETRRDTSAVTENDIRFIPTNQGRLSSYPPPLVHLRGDSVSSPTIYSRGPQKTEISFRVPRDSARRWKTLSVLPDSDNDQQKHTTQKLRLTKEVQKRDTSATRQAWWELPPTPDSELGPRVRGLSVAGFGFDTDLSDEDTARIPPTFAQNLAEKMFRETDIEIGGEGEVDRLNPASRLLGRFRSAIEAIDETLWA